MGSLSDAPFGRAVPTKRPQYAQQTSEASDKGSSRPMCSKCAKPTLRRVKRKGFWQKVVLGRFGFYPWECSACRKIIILRNRGQNRRHSKSGGAIE